MHNASDTLKEFIRDAHDGTDMPWTFAAYMLCKYGDNTFIERWRDGH